MGTALRRNGSVRIVVAFVSFFVFTFLFSYGAYFLSGLWKVPATSVAHEQPETIQNAGGPALSALASPNKRSRLIGMTTKAADETDAAAETLFREIEPPSLPKDKNLRAANRDDLEALRRALETAATDAATIMPRYLALLKSERGSVENHARSLNAEKDFIAKLLGEIDKQHAELASMTSQLLTARADFYHTYETYVALLVDEFGSYKVVNGQFIFPNQRTVDRYNVAAHAMVVAAKRVSELEQERRRLMQLKEEQWRQFVQND
jgi:hypothetical protein